MTKQSRQIVVSAMRPTGLLHLGHFFGVLQNWKNLQKDYSCYFFAADWHALTTDYSDVRSIRKNLHEMVVDWLAVGIDPNEAVLFVQSRIPEHAELHLLLSMITPIGWLERVPSYKELQKELKEKDLSTYGFLGYPLLQTADVAIYKAQKVPVGTDQAAHIELAREIVRRFNFLYQKEIFPEPQSLLSESPRVLGTDGRKMSKSYGNCIYLSDPVDAAGEKFMKHITDPARMRRTDAGNPDVCPIFDYHKLVSDKGEQAQINEDCRKAAIGCIDCKKILLKNMNQVLAPFREARKKLEPEKVRQVMEEGCKKAQAVARRNLEEANEAMGLEK